MKASAFLQGLKGLHRDLPHDIFPGFSFHPVGDEDKEELFCGDAEHEFFLRAPSVPKKVLQGQDPVHSLVTRKQAWTEQFNNINFKRQAWLGPKRIKVLKKKIQSKKTDVLVVPHYEARYLKLAREDPDPDFSEYYNWYYTGGCLSHVSVTWKQQLLLSARGDRLCLSLMEHIPSWKASLPCTATATPEKQHPILQVGGVKAGNAGLVGVRLKNRCVFYTVDPTAPSLQQCGVAESKTSSFLGLDIRNEPQVQCCSVDSSRTVKLWDLGTMKKCSEHHLAEYSKTRGPRIQIHFGCDGNNVVVADSHNLWWWDIRREKKPRHRLSLMMREDLLPCEEISLVVRSRRARHLVYVATTHKLSAVDERRGSWEPVYEWTHQMTSPPLYGHVLVLPTGQEVVCVANQRPATVVLAVPSTRQLLKPATILDSLDRAQSRGECLEPFLAARLGQSLAGIACLPPDQPGMGFSLLSLTAAGDVLHQRIWAGTAALPGQGLTGDLSVPDKRLHSTRRCNLWDLRAGLRNEKLKLAAGIRPKSQPWHRSKEQLLAFQDVLAPVLLDIWNLDDCPEWAEDAVEDRRMEEERAFQKVSSWLNKVSHGKPENDKDLSSDDSEDPFQSQE